MEPLVPRSAVSSPFARSDVQSASKHFVLGDQQETWEVIPPPALAPIITVSPWKESLRLASSAHLIAEFLRKNAPPASYVPNVCLVWVMVVLWAIACTLSLSTMYSCRQSAAVPVTLPAGYQYLDPASGHQYLDHQPVTGKFAWETGQALDPQSSSSAAGPQRIVNTHTTTIIVLGTAQSSKTGEAASTHDRQDTAGAEAAGGSSSGDQARPASDAGDRQAYQFSEDWNSLAALRQLGRRQGKGKGTGTAARSAQRMAAMAEVMELAT